MHLWLFGKTHHKTVQHESSAPTLFKNRELSVVNFPVFSTLRIISLNEEKKNHVPEVGFEPTSSQIIQKQGKLGLDKGRFFQKVMAKSSNLSK